VKILIFGFGENERAPLGQALERMGHEAVLETDGNAALAKIRDADIRIVIADSGRREFDALKLCRRLRSDLSHPYVYFLLVSGKEMPGAAGNFISALTDEGNLGGRLHTASRVIESARRICRRESAFTICSHCKRVRDEADHWQEFEGYVALRMRAQVNFSICPDCYIKTFGPEFSASRIESSESKSVQPPI
jgi:CheY-like chemotaxis protein